MNAPRPLVASALGLALAGLLQEPAPEGGATPPDAPSPLERAVERAREEEAYFAMCDLDDSGWLSFGEGETTLGFTKAEFRAYDADSDGRIDRAEFAARYRTVLERLGVVAPPSSPRAAEPDPDDRTGLFPSAEDLLALYDRDASGGLDPLELARLVTDLAADVAPDAVLAQMDTDRGGSLELRELGPLARLVAERLPPSMRLAGVSELDLSGLRGKTVTRPTAAGGAPEPPRIAGPVTHFRRLDLDDDGRIEAEDLRALAVATPLDVRPEAVLAALDRDGDGALDAGELRSALAPTQSRDAEPR